MRHPYHLLDLSPWPILVSLNLLFTLLSLVAYLNGYIYSLINVKLGLLLIVGLVILWAVDIYTEVLLGYHTYYVSKGILLGFIVFLSTEVMLFFSLFWGYFHSGLNVTTLVWPPIGLELVNPYGIPLLNTLLLLYSGVLATVSHHEFMTMNRKGSLTNLIFGIFLGAIFFCLQVYEYFHSSFDFSDSVYSSAFYLLTGMHGFHVIVGVVLLVIVLIRVYLYTNPNIFYDIALIYYHFVDVVWILLFILIYYMSY